MVYPISGRTHLKDLKAMKFVDDRCEIDPNASHMILNHEISIK